MLIALRVPEAHEGFLLQLDREHRTTVAHQAGLSESASREREETLCLLGLFDLLFDVAATCVNPSSKQLEPGAPPACTTQQAAFGIKKPSLPRK